MNPASSAPAVRFVVGADSPAAPDVRALLTQHLRFTSAMSPPEDCHALDSEGLADDRVALFSVRENGRLLVIGALKQLDDEHAELKSMHTTAAARGQGIARLLVEHLLSVARKRRFRRVSLETGSMEGFAPARNLYASVGFELCEPFGEYLASSNSVWMTLALPPGEVEAAQAAD